MCNWDLGPGGITFRINEELKIIIIIVKLLLKEKGREKNWKVKKKGKSPYKKWKISSAIASVFSLLFDLFVDNPTDRRINGSDDRKLAEKLPYLPQFPITSLKSGFRFSFFMDSDDDSETRTRKGSWPVLILRCSLALLFPILSFFVFSFFVGLVAVFLANSSASSPISVPSQCKIVSSSEFLTLSLLSWVWSWVLDVCLSGEKSLEIVGENWTWKWKSSCFEYEFDWMRLLD